MSGRELLLRALDGETVPRVPVAPFIHVNLVRAFYGDQDVDVVGKTVDVHEHFGFDIIHRNCTPAYDDLNLSGDGWELETSTLNEGRNETTTRVVHTPKGDLREVVRLYWTSEYDAEWTPVEYLINSEDDLELLMAYQPAVGEIDVSPIVRAKEALGDRGVTAPWIQGAFNHVAYFYRPLEQLVLDAITDPATYGRMMDYFLERNKRIASQFIVAGVDALSYGGNIASGKMVGYDFFMEHVFPYEKQLTDFIQERGARVLYHNCGCARVLFPAYRGLGMRAYESLTPAPYGDTVLEEAFEAIGPDVTLCGHIDQIEFLRKAGPQDIRAKVKQVLDVAKRRGRFVLGTSDYFNEDTPRDSILALAEAGREFGGL